MSLPVILLVEDEPDTVELMSKAFQRSAIAAQLVVARDGVEALEWLLSTSKAPRLVLLDMHLPKVGGLEVLEKLRAHPRGRRWPVVMLTSSRDEREMHESYALGANSYVHKPVDFTDLVALAKLLGAYWLDLNEPPPEGT